MADTPNSNVEISKLSRENSSPAFSLACKVFAQESVLHKATGVSIEDYREYLNAPFEAMREQQLSLVATDSTTKQVIGCLIACDYAIQIHNPIESPESVKPINALLQQLDKSYRETRRIIPGQFILVDMAIVSPGARGRSIYQKLREAAHLVARNAGYKWAVGELSSAATQRVCVNKFGHKVCAEIEYSSFEYSGRRPFSTIQAPPSIQLVEADLWR